MTTILSSTLAVDLPLALSRTIVHTLWQGAIISFLLTAALYLLRRSTAATRYNVSVAALLLMFITTAATFTYIYKGIGGNLGNPVAATIATYQQAYVNDPLPLQSGSSVLETVTATVKLITDRYNNIISIIWLAGILFLSMRLAGNFWFLKKLRTTAITPLPEEWIKRVERLASGLQIGRKVRIAESVRAMVPMVIGHLKPLILLPAGMATGLSPAELEPILLHELAHIRRNDFIINVIQSIIDILLFFNPFARYITLRVRVERENACDDIAVEKCNTRQSYAKALLLIHEFRFGQPEVAMAITGSNNLFHRIKRIVAMEKKESTFINGGFTAVALFAALTLLLLIASPNAKAGATPVEADAEIALIGPEPLPAEPPVIVVQDTTARQKYERTFRTIVTDPDDGVDKKIELRYKKNGELSEILIDGKTIAPSEHNKYRKVIEEAEADEKRVREELADLRADLEISMKEIGNIDFESIRAEIDLNMEEVKRSLEQAKLEMEKIDMEAIRRDMKKAMESIPDDIMKDIQIDIEKVRAEIEIARSKIIIPDINDQMKLTEEQKAEIKKSMEEARAEIQKAVEELQKNIEEGHTRIIIDRNEKDSTSTAKKEEMQKKLEEMEASKSKGKKI
jgi:beta-lactamase regulating signal transducer with metallopeptidase domain